MLLKFLKVFLFFIFCFGFQLNILEAQSMWPALSKVSYKKEYDALLGIKVDRPVFSSDVKSLAGKIIQLKGYIIPTDGFKSHTEFVFSAFPYSSCFFCGKAGPETVIEIQAKEPIQYTSEPIEIKGKLILNEKDINRLMYLMVEVEKL
ncbi:MAG: hypothetical protein IPO86_04520 [Saprospiraceae bacterium]|nr:hypothetical protein [Saprospiraceae bacterium]MBK8485352.1 hypothetical protein [Saprospiraceae bacterium]MBK9727367.1 hypothetical protein [Saprospiraceae bacterium]